MPTSPPGLLTPDEAEYFRTHRKAWLEACRRSPTLFIAHMTGLGPGQMHVELQKFLQQAAEDGADSLTLVPRNHAKTTQGSVGLTPWEIGQPPSAAYPEGGLNERYQIVQATKPDAKKTVRSIKRILESDRYREIFPWVEPDREQWGVEALCVKRTRLGLRDPTLSAQPINGTAGQRADKLVPDDIENFDNSIRSAANRENVKEAWVNTWVPTIEPDAGDKGGIIRAFATPWHPDGITMDWLRTAESGKPRHGSLEDSTALRAFVRRCRGTEWSPWHERWTPQRLLRQLRRMGRAAYERAYELKCITSEDCIFAESDLLAAAGPLPDRKNLRGSVRVAASDFAFTGDELGLKGPRKGTRDYASMLVADLTPAGDVFMVYAFRERTTYPKFKAHVVGTCRRLDVKRFRGESNAKEVALVQDLRAALAPLGISTKGRVRETDKPSRAAGVSEVVEGHRFHIRTDDQGDIVNDERFGGCMKALYDELRQFPLGTHDDLVDPAVDLMDEAEGGPQAVLERERKRDYRRLDDIEAEEEEADAGAEPKWWTADDDD